MRNYGCNFTFESFIRNNSARFALILKILCLHLPDGWVRWKIFAFGPNPAIVAAFTSILYITYGLRSVKEYIVCVNGTVTLCRHEEED